LKGPKGFSAAAVRVVFHFGQVMDNGIEFQWSVGSGVMLTIDDRVPALVLFVAIRKSTTASDRCLSVREHTAITAAAFHHL